MSRGPTNDEDAPAMQCAAHPDVETELACGRCETPICPRCMIQTPVGARCRNCARLRQLPMYTVRPTNALLGAVAAIGGGVVVGVLWGILSQALFPRGFPLGFFGIFIGAAVGSPLGYAFAGLLDRATGRKRGPVIQGIAIAGLVVAYLAQAAVRGTLAADLFVLAALVSAGAAAFGRLR